MARRGNSTLSRQSDDEIAADKAERSRNYRASQTMRNLVAALLATLVVVVVIVLGVPRGEPAPRPAIDVAAVAHGVEDTYGREVIVPVVPESWRVNGAQVEADAVATWGIIYVPDENSFLRVAQGFDADRTWAAQLLKGAAPNGTITLDGLSWDRYEIADPSRNANVSYALGIQAGPDHIVVYGSADPETTAQVAGSIADQVRALQEAAE
ncbi:MAG TPA: DUF4245 family protein [Microbacterium sp.]|uniref:DUF4245 family protein n=1 Tax=Microbacterium sp. TaxID=51671 RepID=UPI002BA253DC|nr:DUF4245 family protein [Microbacterium sp.]HWI32532.1 DUF4245 family protein [Microbacterium sp.]